MKRYVICVAVIVTLAALAGLTGLGAVHGRGAAVVMDVEVYEDMLDKIALLRAPT